LKESDYDLIFNDAEYHETIFSSYLDKPSMMQFFYAPSYSLMGMFGMPSVSNTYYPMTSSIRLLEDDSNFKWTLMKITEAIGPVICDLYLLPLLMEPAKLHPEFKETFSGEVRSKGYVFGIGTDGFLDRVQTDGKTAMFYPALPSKSKFNPEFMEKSLPVMYTEFIDRYDGIIYISFGTMFMPSLEQMSEIVKMIQLVDKT
jgi:hypothetical protein